MDDLTPDMEMSSKEAAAYLSGPVGYTLSQEFLRSLRYDGRGPLVEKRGARLVYRKATLDAFLREHGTDPAAWYAGIWRDLAEEIRVVSAATGVGGFEPLIEALEKHDPEDWDPDQAK